MQDLLAVRLMQLLYGVGMLCMTLYPGATLLFMTSVMAWLCLPIFMVVWVVSGFTAGWKGVYAPPLLYALTIFACGAIGLLMQDVNVWVAFTINLLMSLIAWRIFKVTPEQWAEMKKRAEEARTARMVTEEEDIMEVQDESME